MTRSTVWQVTVLYRGDDGRWQMIKTMHAFTCKRDALDRATLMQQTQRGVTERWFVKPLTVINKGEV